MANVSGQSATHPALAAEAHTEGVPPGYELVSANKHLDYVKVALLKPHIF